MLLLWGPDRRSRHPGCGSCLRAGESDMLWPWSGLRDCAHSGNGGSPLFPRSRYPTFVKFPNVQHAKEPLGWVLHSLGLAHGEGAPARHSHELRLPNARPQALRAAIGVGQPPLQVPPLRGSAGSWSTQGPGARADRLHQRGSHRGSHQGHRRDVRRVAQRPRLLQRPRPGSPNACPRRRSQGGVPRRATAHSVRGDWGQGRDSGRLRPRAAARRPWRRGRGQGGAAVAELL
mmetsp:Transcript_73238/g.191134  ORF Transcript_73238/g.191134 Transcript_73238/m.191134 type:complete len:232 (-) Transcript_73238:649-1344(-)